ncbi:MAG: hypothetical protein JWR15_2849 [Prosthecobacter sp.]|nr:hypothetical protein [Prosthecobacter sp.]
MTPATRPEPDLFSPSSPAFSECSPFPKTMNHDPDSGSPSKSTTTASPSDANAELMARRAFGPTTDLTRHLRPVDAPVPAWAAATPAPAAPAADPAHAPLDQLRQQCGLPPLAPPANG